MPVFSPDLALCLYPFKSAAKTGHTVSNGDISYCWHPGLGGPGFATGPPFFRGPASFSHGTTRGPVFSTGTAIHNPRITRGLAFLSIVRRPVFTSHSWALQGMHWRTTKGNQDCIVVKLCRLILICIGSLMYYFPPVSRVVSNYDCIFC